MSTLLKRVEDDNLNVHGQNYLVNRAMLEGLLDIRDLLSKEQPNGA
jgi:hypothetical protein